MLLALAAPVRGQQYYLYTPKEVAPEQAQHQGKDGVLVREVPVEKGNTLFGLSRKFSGHGSYYPQILLFNDIKNPDLIHTGDTLRVPVTAATQDSEGAPVHKHKTGKRRAVKAAKSATAPVARPKAAAVAPGAAKPADPLAELSLSDLKKLDAKPKHQSSKRKKAAMASKKPVHNGKPSQGAPGVGTVRTSQPETAPRPTATQDVTAGQRLFEKGLKAYQQNDCRAALDFFDRFLADNSASPLAADASLYKAECYLKLSSQ